MSAPEGKHRHACPVLALVRLLGVSVVLAGGPGTVLLDASAAWGSDLVINEVLRRNDALNYREMRDDDNTKQGWIELYNRGDAPVSLDGYYLSNDREPSLKWALPAATLEGGEYLIVWTSGEDRRDPNAALHASFNMLTADTLYLLNSQAEKENALNVLQDVRIPVDHSWGRYPDGAEERYFYTQPTPGYANTATGKRRFAIYERHISLTAGNEIQLTLTPPGTDVIWVSDNPLVQVRPDGRVVALADALGEDSRATLTAVSAEGDCDMCQVTIVSWMANLSSLVVTGTPRGEYLLGAENGTLFVAIGGDLYCTKDGFATMEFQCPLPESPTPNSAIVATPFGYVYRGDREIHTSSTLRDWQHSFTTHKGGLWHGFSTDWDPETKTGYVYVGEYSCDPDHRHCVFRGVFPRDGSTHWEKVLEFASLAEWEADWSILDAARHIHVVTCDPYTGHVWVGTGDYPMHARLLYSDDQGGHFRLLVMGDNPYRTLSIWFTEQYVYWNMDVRTPQSVWRIPRSVFEEHGIWPSLTPDMVSGETKPGTRYYIIRNETPGYFPKNVGNIYREDRARPLSEMNAVRPVDDPAYDYREHVALLDNGSLWYCLPIRTDHGEHLVVMGGAAEGALRDYRGRVFGIKEAPDGTPQVQELLSVSSTRPGTLDGSTQYVQLVPKAQDAEGYIYFEGLKTNHRIYQTRLAWTDQP